MNEMQSKLNKYYEEASIVSVKKVTDSNGCYDYDEMFRSFCCSMKDSCRNACERAYESSYKDPKFLFSPRTDYVAVSQYYVKRKYKGHRIPRIVVVSLSLPKPEPEPKPKLNPHWRGTTTTVRSLLDPFIHLDPAGDREDKSTKIIEQLFVHVRTAKCFSNAGGTGEETRQLYDNCGCYLKKEVSILKPDVIVTQGNTVHDKSEDYVFDEGAKKAIAKKVEGIANSIACIVHLQEGKRKVYWLRSHFPYGGFYSQNHAGRKIGSERGAKLKNLVLYGRDIKEFMDMEGR